MIKKGSIVFTVFMFILNSAALAQVNSHQKISDTQGNFSAALDDYAHFGKATLSFPYPTGNRVLITGAPGDDGHGAIHFLSLVDDGTVDDNWALPENASDLDQALDTGDFFGGSLAQIGDLDTDGMPDLAVGAYFDGDGGTNRGAVYILFLNNNCTVKDFQKISDTAGLFSGVLDDGDRFGHSCAGIGDLDADGVPDLAVGAPYDDDGGMDSGAVWILFLNTDGTVKSHQKISNDEGYFFGTFSSNGRAGESCTSLGDLDGDRIPDIAAGATWDEDVVAGAVWILFLNRDGTVKNLQKISASHGGFSGSLAIADGFGSSLTCPGDLDGDGIPDMAAGATGDDDGGAERGAVWILYLNSDGSVKYHQKISDTEGNFTGTLDDVDYFGTSCAFHGDLNGDSVPELVVGSRGDDDGGTSRGALWVLFPCPPVPAESPSPDEWQTGISPGGDTLNWADVAGASGYDVYIGDTYPPATCIASDISVSQCFSGILQPCTQYFWQVVPKIDCSYAAGEIWSFFTSGAAAGYPQNPYPADGASDIPLDITLDWDDVPDAISYDLYAGTGNPPALAAAGLTESECPFAGLDLGTTYYWFVVANKTCWEVSYSPLWSFTTHPGFTISGHVSYDGNGLEGVEIWNLPGTPQTDSSGDYSVQVEPGWSGTAFAVMSGYHFEPSSIPYASVSSDYTGQDYTGFPLTDNIPTSYQVLPEVIWAGSGGGTWMTEVQLTDLTGGSLISAYFNSVDGTRRGPIPLWNNTGGAEASRKITNILLWMYYLDPGYYYYNKVGALEFVTQDADHKIQVSARTKNGDYSKTFPGLNLTRDNTAAAGRPLMVQNLVSNSTYRSAAGLFNPTDESVTVGIDLFDANGADLGSTFSYTLAGHEYKAFNPFDEAGVTGNQDNVWMQILPNSGSGKVMAFGATANENTNDPAAHLAKQVIPDDGVFNGPGWMQILPEVIWAGSGGGSWMTEVQITDMTGGTVVDVYFNPGGGVRRGPITIWDNSGGSSQSSFKCANLLETIDSLDSGYDYSNKVGAVEFHTQGASNHIQVSARTLMGDFSKTFPGFLAVPENTISSGETLMVQNLVADSNYRTAFGAYNPTGDSVTAEFRLYDGDGNQIGSAFSKTLDGYDFQAFNPFGEAGASGDQDNVFIKVTAASGSGKVMVYGATANQNTNDPAAHFAVKY
jgi:hypothetical protein